MTAHSPAVQPGAWVMTPVPYRDIVKSQLRWSWIAVIPWRCRDAPKYAWLVPRVWIGTQIPASALVHTLDRLDSRCFCNTYVLCCKLLTFSSWSPSVYTPSPMYTMMDTYDLFYHKNIAIILPELWVDSSNFSCSPTWKSIHFSKGKKRIP